MNGSLQPIGKKQNLFLNQFVIFKQLYLKGITDIGTKINSFNFFILKRNQLYYVKTVN